MWMTNDKWKSNEKVSIYQHVEFLIGGRFAQLCVIFRLENQMARRTGLKEYYSINKSEYLYIMYKILVHLRKQYSLCICPWKFGIQIITYQTINLYIGGNKIKRLFIGRTCHICMLHLHVTFTYYIYMLHLHVTFTCYIYLLHLHVTFTCYMYKWKFNL